MRLKEEDEMATAWDMVQVYSTMTVKDRESVKRYQRIVDQFEELSPEERMSLLNHLEHSTLM